jgi:hypothetical protein
MWSTTALKTFLEVRGKSVDGSNDELAARWVLKVFDFVSCFLNFQFNSIQFQLYTLNCYLCFLLLLFIWEKIKLFFVLVLNCSCSCSLQCQMMPVQTRLV